MREAFMQDNLDQKFISLKRQVSDLKTQKLRLEGEMHNLQQEKQAILQSASDLGIDAKQLDASIVELENDIQTKLASLEEQLNGLNSKVTQFTR
jgi:predicted  nucleic acid-binding Zn-ribbon protein